MNEGQTVFSQVMDFLPLHEFRKCVLRYEGDYKVLKFSCLDQYLCMAFAQLTYRESLRDIEICLRPMRSKLYHMGIRGGIARSTLADANEHRDWRIYADFAHVLIATARKLYLNDDFGIALHHTTYVLDSTTIDLCLALFPWARFRKRKGAVKIHTLLDLRGNIPSFIAITPGKVHDVNVLDQLIPETGAFYIMDRGYLDFLRLYMFTQHAAFFVTRAKNNMQYHIVEAKQVEADTGVITDQLIVLTGVRSKIDYPDKLRRVRYFDIENKKCLVFLTNNFTLAALTIALLYKQRWQVELFFKWIKQHLRIKAFYGTSDNAVKTQIWIAVSIYVLVAITKKQLQLKQSLYAILQIFSISLFEKIPLNQLFNNIDPANPATYDRNQLILFE